MWIHLAWPKDLKELDLMAVNVPPYFCTLLQAHKNTVPVYLPALVVGQQCCAHIKPSAKHQQPTVLHDMAA